MTTFFLFGVNTPLRSLLSSPCCLVIDLELLSICGILEWMYSAGGFGSIWRIKRFGFLATEEPFDFKSEPEGILTCSRVGFLFSSSKLLLLVFDAALRLLLRLPEIKLFSYFAAPEFLLILWSLSLVSDLGFLEIVIECASRSLLRFCLVFDWSSPWSKIVESFKFDFMIVLILMEFKFCW